MCLFIQSFSIILSIKRWAFVHRMFLLHPFCFIGSWYKYSNTLLGIIPAIPSTWEEGMNLGDNYPLHSLYSDLFGKVLSSLLSPTLWCPSCCLSFHSFVFPLFHIMLENISISNPGLHLALNISNWDAFLSSEWPFQWLFVCRPVLLHSFSGLNFFSHSASLLRLFPLSQNLHFLLRQGFCCC